MKYLVLAFVSISWLAFGTTHGYLTGDYQLFVWLGGVAVRLVISSCIINCHQRYVAYRSMQLIKVLVDVDTKNGKDFLDAFRGKLQLQKKITDRYRKYRWITPLIMCFYIDE